MSFSFVYATSHDTKQNALRCAGWKTDRLGNSILEINNCFAVDCCRIDNISLYIDVQSIWLPIDAFPFSMSRVMSFQSALYEIRLQTANRSYPNWT